MSQSESSASGKSDNFALRTNVTPIITYSVSLDNVFKQFSIEVSQNVFCLEDFIFLSLFAFVSVA